MKNTRKNARKVTMKEFRHLLYFYRGAELAITTIMLVIALAFIGYGLYFSFFVSTSHYDDQKIVWFIIPIITCFAIPTILKIIYACLENKYIIRRKQLIEKCDKENKQLSAFRAQIEKDLEGIDLSVIFSSDDEFI